MGEVEGHHRQLRAGGTRKVHQQIREYLREYGIDVRQKLEELAQSDDVEVAEAAQALIAYYWKQEDDER